jgi:hypothetical protein
MRTSTLLRWGGLAALAGGIVKALSELGALLLIGNQADRIAALSWQWLVLLALALTAAFLAMVGLVALYARQAEPSGPRGLFGFSLAALGTMMHFGHLWTGLFLVPALAASVPEFLDSIGATQSGLVTEGAQLALVVFAFGWLLFGLISLQAKVIPPGPAALVMFGATLELVLGILDRPLSSLVFTAGLAWMGYWLWTEQARGEGAPGPAAAAPPDEPPRPPEEPEEEPGLEDSG